MIAPLKHIENLPEERWDELAVLFQKEYSSEALSFIQNHHRTLNYWAAGEVDLLPPLAEGEKRRRYSFFDLVWLGVVKELRDFGMEKEAIGVLKGELLTPPDHKGILKQLKTHRKEMEQLLVKDYGVGSDTFREMLEFYVGRQTEIQSLAYSSLALSIMQVVTAGIDVRILINKEGHHHALQVSEQGASLQGLSDIYQRAHLSLSLKEVIAFFVALPQVSDTVKQKLLSEKEWQLIELVRKSALKSVKVHFNDQKEITLVEMTRKKKVSVEARLTEIIAKGGYEKIEIVTQDGKPVYLESTRKIRL